MVYCRSLEQKRLENFVERKKPPRRITKEKSSRDCMDGDLKGGVAFCGSKQGATEIQKEGEIFSQERGHMGLLS